MDDQDLTQRAIRAYFRASGPHADQPGRAIEQECRRGVEAKHRLMLAERGQTLAEQ